MFNNCGKIRSSLLFIIEQKKIRLSIVDRMRDFRDCLLASIFAIFVIRNIIKDSCD